MALADVEADAGEGVAGFEAHEEDVAWLDAVGVGGGEEAGAGACWVEEGDLVLRYGFDGVGTCFGG